MDTVCLTTLFNPASYSNRYRNYELFKQNLQKQGVPLYTIECALRKQKHYLPIGKYHLRVRSNSILWHKERLINLAVSLMPKTVKNIVWLDCDILYKDPLWFDKLRALLKNFLIVQPFETAHRLKPGFSDVLHFEAQHSSFEQVSFAKRFVENKNLAANGEPIKHGTSGFGWAANIDFFREVGLYDAAILGGGDHLFTHAICGNIQSKCIDKLVSGDSKKHYLKYLDKSSAFVDGNITFLPETIYHIWHGYYDKRQYYQRHKILSHFNFNPVKDLTINQQGCLEWNSTNYRMKDAVENYFYARQEDLV